MVVILTYLTANRAGKGVGDLQYPVPPKGLIFKATALSIIPLTDLGPTASI